MGDGRDAEPPPPAAATPGGFVPTRRRRSPSRRSSRRLSLSFLAPPPPVHARPPTATELLAAGRLTPSPEVLLASRPTSSSPTARILCFLFRRKGEERRRTAPKVPRTSCHRPPGRPDRLPSSASSPLQPRRPAQPLFWPRLALSSTESP
ncbi:hypothetical protein NL676_001821 [Syzygium grande]|nr:hypothetical protein NL676_001821 [Syzygium grande]